MAIGMFGTCLGHTGASGEAEEREGKRQEAVLFLKKKNQKNFCPFADVNAWAPASPPDRSKGGKVFLLLFFQKKKTLALLPLACLA
jgi:hypothetical protein